jgi:hypothetical protein
MFCGRFFLTQCFVKVDFTAKREAEIYGIFQEIKIEENGSISNSGSI